MYKRYLKTLGLDEFTSLSKLKEAYYKKIKENPPETNKQEFILINESYDYLLKFYKDREDFQERLDDLIIDILHREEHLKGKNLVLKIQNLFSIITLDNFEEVSSSIVDTVVLLKSNNFIEVALLLCFMAESIFRKIGLNNLAQAYRNLAETVVYR